jgi:hypothetical protein
MNISASPLVAIGTLSGNLPKNATTAAGPLPGADGAPAGGTIGLDQSNAVQGVTMTPFKAMRIGGAASLTPAQLAFFQQQFQEQTADASSNQANGLSYPPKA